MKVAILDDWFDTLRTLPCLAKLDGHEVTVFTDHVDDVDELAARLADTEVLVLIRERTPVGRPLLARLPQLRLISQRSVYPHIDVDACTELGIVVSSDMHAGSPSYATAELTWGLVLAAARRIPQQMASLRSGAWQAGVGHTLRSRTLGVYGYGRIGQEVLHYGQAFGMRVQVWGSEAARARAAADGLGVPASRREFFGTSDVVSVHLRLLDATRGHTTILISHRFSTVRQADLICVLETGQVVELGTHDELIRRQGRYHTMYTLQAARFEDRP